MRQLSNAERRELNAQAMIDATALGPPVLAMDRAAVVAEIAGLDRRARAIARMQDRIPAGQGDPLDPLSYEARAIGWRRIDLQARLAELNRR